MPTVQDVAKTLAASSRALKPTKTETYVLPTDDPARVMSAGGPHRWRVQLRNIGPPGSIAFVSTDPNALVFPSMTTQIPAGGFTDIGLRPGDGLFARGSIAGVQLSVAASEDVA